MEVSVVGKRRSRSDTAVTILVLLGLLGIHDTIATSTMFHDKGKMTTTVVKSDDLMLFFYGLRIK